tara:strand:+ start:2416 stop:2550 length:135 start_codon:yes stop_codon:yes gene_type:complete
MTAALALGRALGINALLAAEILPEIEGIAIRALNEEIRLENPDG